MIQEIKTIKKTEIKIEISEEIDIKMIIDKINTETIIEEEIDKALITPLIKD